jgi:class 3 adenylate cyclase/predicted ATPase
MRCSKCGFDNPGRMKFCGQCTAPLALVCPKCHFENPPGFKFCGQCTTALGSDSVNPRSSNPAITIRVREGSSVLDGERKTVTALFADIKGSMELMEDLDPEEARAIVDPALKLMIEAVRRYDGYVVQSTGDGIFALFGAPVGHEDHPQRALYAALRIQDEMRRYSAKLRQGGESPVEARVGVNSGEVVVRSIATGADHAEYAPIGHSTSLAARVQALAPTGSVAATDAIRKLCEGFFIFATLGRARIKGVSEPIEVFEVTGLGPLRTRFQRAEVRGLTKFVGRQREMAALKQASEQARAGHGQIVSVTADPGVGKSRLFYEFKANCQSGWTLLEGIPVSYGKASAYLPLLELLSAYFEISRDDNERKRRELILGKVLGLDRGLEDILPYLYFLYGIAEAGNSLAQMDPSIRRRRTQEAIKRIVLLESLHQPLMIIFEDLHWIDSDTQALLNLLVDVIANASILLLVNYRSEYRDEWGSRTYYTQLRLDPLGRQSAQEMLSALLGEDKDLSPLKRQIVERTQGTPFFMEEMVQALFEEGVIQRNGNVKLTKAMRVVKVPATVQALLASRIDRLSTADKELLQTLAVLGREFPPDLVERVTSKSRTELKHMLAQLELSEFIYEQPAATHDIEYIFKHALTQEVAYKSLLNERRRALHDRAGTAIEGLYAHQLNDHYSDLAHHYLRGNNTTKAVQYAQLAAEQAVSRGSYAEATSLIEEGLKLVDRLSDESKRLRSELALRNTESMLGFVLHGASSIEREHVIRRICQLAQKLAEGDHLLRGLILLSGLEYTRGEPIRGLQLARRYLDLTNTVREEGLLADARYLTGVLAQSCGFLTDAVSHFEVAVRLMGQTNNNLSQWGMLRASLFDCQLGAPALQLLGRVKEATIVAERGLRLARESRHLFSLGHALSLRGRLSRYQRQPEAALLHAEEAISLSEENAFPPWLHWARFHHGWALSESGQIERGVAEMEAGIAGFESLGGVSQEQYTIALLAEAYGKMGRTERALVMLDGALERIERTGEKVDYAEMLRLKGEILMKQDSGGAHQAEACFRTAHQAARLQEAKWWELRSSVSLARLLRDTDRRDEARTMLTEIYGWFTEGFDMVDLKEAKALLDEYGARDS